MPVKKASSKHHSAPSKAKAAPAKPAPKALAAKAPTRKFSGPGGSQLQKQSARDVIDRPTSTEIDQSYAQGTTQSVSVFRKILGWF